MRSTLSAANQFCRRVRSPRRLRDDDWRRRSGRFNESLLRAENIEFVYRMHCHRDPFVFDFHSIGAGHAAGAKLPSPYWRPPGGSYGAIVAARGGAGLGANRVASRLLSLAYELEYSDAAEALEGGLAFNTASTATG